MPKPLDKEEGACYNREKGGMHMEKLPSLSSWREKIPKGKYRHYKGGLYEVLDVAYHSETLEPMVVYRALYGEGELWVRPASMWCECVGDVPRFSFVEEEK
jgi:hypothetical protein